MRASQVRVDIEDPALDGPLTGGDAPVEIRDEDPLDVGEIQGEVEFRSLTFGYGETKILHDIDLKVPAGTTVAIVGPTASGKSSLALRVARARGGEIVSCDSLQVYRGLDIGSAKATQAERRDVRHHLIDVVDHGENMGSIREEMYRPPGLPQRIKRAIFNDTRITPRLRLEFNLCELGAVPPPPG